MEELGSDQKQPQADLAEAPIDYLKQKLARGADNFGSSANFNRVQAFRFAVFTATAGALTTLFIGLSAIVDGNAANIFKGLALVFSAAVPVLISWNSFFDHYWCWIKYTDAYSRFRGIEDRIGFREAAGGPISMEEMSKFFEEYRSVYEDTNGAWQTKRATPAAIEGLKSHEGR